MLDHFGFRVRDLAAAHRFYDHTMKAIGLEVIDSTETSFPVGRSAREPIPFLWVGTDKPSFWRPAHATSASPIHVAFSAPDRAAVDAFREAALAHGGIDNGVPGPRGPAEMNYYAALPSIRTATIARRDTAALRACKDG